MQVKADKINPVAAYEEARRRESSPLVKAANGYPGLMRFRAQAQFIIDRMPKKNQGEAGVHPSYWLEVKDPKHRDRISLNGLDSQCGAFGAWREDDEGELGLFQWVDKNPHAEVKQFKDGPTHPLSQGLGYINYLSPSQAASYRVDISKGEWKAGDVLLDTTHLQGKPGMDGHAAIVIHRDGNVFVHPYEKGKWQHTSTTQGKPVLSAGMIRIEQGKVKSFHLDSGHYVPQLPQLEHFLARMARRGVNISEIDIRAKHIAEDQIEALVSRYSR